VLGAFATLLPAEAGYLQQRLSSSGTSSAIVRDANVEVRMQDLSSTFAIIDRRDPVFGVGFPAASPAQTAQIELWGADIAWVPVLYNLGLVGAAAFGMLFIGYGVRALRLFARNEGDGEYLGLVYLIAVVTSLMLTMNTRSFMEPAALPMALWLFAFVAAEARRRDEDDATVTVHTAESSQ
jgi:hypothetical protein